MIENTTADELYYQGQDLLVKDKTACKLRRQKIQMVFQNPYASLNPRKKNRSDPRRTFVNQYLTFCYGT